MRDIKITCEEIKPKFRIVSEICCNISNQVIYLSLFVKKLFDLEKTETANIITVRQGMDHIIDKSLYKLSDYI